jgi:hypothetical protein
MIRWELLTDETAWRIWDKRLAEFPDCSPFQMYSWGAQQRALGWQPLHLAAFGDNGEMVAMMLALLRRYPLGVGMVWCAGGPVGDTRAWGEGLQQALLRASGARWLYCRFRPDRERNVSDALALHCQGWTRSWFMLHSGWSMELDLRHSEPELLAGCSSDWRRNLRRANENGVRVRPWLNPDVGEMLAVYEELQARKGLPELFSRPALERFLQLPDDNFALFRGDDESGRLVCFRGCLITGSRAADYLAATNERGRRRRASYPTLWELLRHCRARGVQSYDLSGIDPHRNPGVYSFKKETGARPVEGLGEWDWANAGWLRWFGNWAIMRRDHHRQPAPGRHTAASAPALEAVAPQEGAS